MELTHMNSFRTTWKLNIRFKTSRPILSSLSTSLPTNWNNSHGKPETYLLSMSIFTILKSQRKLRKLINLSKRFHWRRKSQYHRRISIKSKNHQEIRLTSCKNSTKEFAIFWKSTVGTHKLTSWNMSSNRLFSLFWLRKSLKKTFINIPMLWRSSIREGSMKS